MADSQDHLPEQQAKPSEMGPQSQAWHLLSIWSPEPLGPHNSGGLGWDCAVTGGCQPGHPESSAALSQSSPYLLSGPEERGGRFAASHLRERLSQGFMSWQATVNLYISTHQRAVLIPHKGKVQIQMYMDCQFIITIGILYLGK